MAIQIQGNSGVVAEVGGTTFRAVHTHVKPLEYGAYGHYRIALRILSTAAQTAASRLLELRNNSAAVFVIPTRLVMRVLQVAAGTAQENSVDAYKATSFTVASTVNAVTGVASSKRTATMAAPASTQAQLRYLTQTGVAAGMTGSTVTKDTNPVATLPYNVAAAIGTVQPWGPVDAFDDVNGTHPLVFTQNEGLVIENRVLNVTSFGVAWYFDLAWAEVASF